MNYGCYASISELKAILGITSTSSDTIIRKALEAASRGIDKYCNRTFIVTTATKYFDGANVLWTPDLLSITTLKTDEDGDAVFENTYEATDYILYGVGKEDTLNTYPKIRIEVSEDSDYSSFAAGVRKGVQIAGVWGYAESTTPYTADTTLSAAISSASATTCTVTSATNLSAGQVILIDTEQLYIQSITSTTLTVIRGVNGTTAATHIDASQLYIYEYPPDIKQACLDLGVAIYQNRGRQGLQSERIGDYAYVMAGTSTGKGYADYILSNTISNYRRVNI